MKKNVLMLIAILMVALVSIPSAVIAAAQVGTVEAGEYAPTNTIIEFAQLTAATDNTQRIHLVGSNRVTIYKDVMFQVKVAAITTNVVYRLEGSLNGTDWFNLDSNAGNITKTANGTYSVNYSGDGQITYIRLYWVSESGGTAATLDVSAKVYERGGN